MSRIGRALLVGAAALVGLLMALLLVARPVGYRTIVVHGPSMGKSVPSGSLVVGRLVGPGSVHVGDIIVVRESVDGAPNTPKVHRVTSIVEDDGQTLVTTKGDANSAADPVPYVLSSHTLRIVTTIPFVGRLVRFVGSPVGWLLLIVVPAISLSAVYLQRLWRKDPVRDGMKRLGALSGIVAAILAATVAIAQPIDALGLFTSTRTVPANAFTTGSLAAPTSLAASPSGASIALSWGATTSASATGYNVLRATASGGPYSTIAQVTPRTTVVYTDSTAASGVTYFYVVQAYYQSWISPNSNQASAATCTIALIQKTSGGGTANSFSATFTATPTVGNLLIAVAGTRINGTMVAPAGWSTAINQTATPAPQAAIFYKLAGASEPTTVTVTTDATGNGNGIHLYEYRCLTTFDLASSATGSSKSVSSGSVTTTQPKSLIIAGLVARQGVSLTSWTNGFTEQNDFTQGAGGALTVFAAGDRIVSSTGTFSTIATSDASGQWRGQIVTFH